MPVRPSDAWITKYPKNGWVNTPPVLPAITNESFSLTDPAFKAACEKAGVKPTKRQASKFKRKLGSAYKAHREALVAN